MTHGRFEAIRKLAEQCKQSGHELDEFQALIEMTEYADRLVSDLQRCQEAAFRLIYCINLIHWDDETPNTAEWLDGLRTKLESLESIIAVPVPSKRS